MKVRFWGILLWTFVSVACSDPAETDDTGNDDTGTHCDAGCQDSGTVDTGALLLPGDHLFTLQNDGMERVYHVHVPAGFNPTQPAPLIMHLHAVTLNGHFHPMYTNMNFAADPRGYLGVFPDGTLGEFELEPILEAVPGVLGGRGTASWNGGACCEGENQTMQDDTVFLKAVLEEVAQVYPVDRSRVYITGMSNGAFMAHRLICEGADWIAAVAPVAGVLGIPPEDCQLAASVGVLQIIGSEDDIDSWEGALPVADNHALWGEQNGCSDTPIETYVNGMIRCEAFPDCQDGVEVELCMAEGGGHNWPNTPYVFDGRPVEDIDNNYILDFFDRHQR